MWSRFCRHRTAYWSLAAFLGLLSAAVLLSPLSLRWFNVQDLSGAVRGAPTSTPITRYAVYSGQLGEGSGGSMLSSIAPTVYGAAGWMGYDALGRSLLFRVLFGWLVSLGIGLGAAFMSLTIGVAWGAVAGLAGGRVDAVMMRVVDVLYGLPYVLFVILLMVVLEEPLSGWFGAGKSVANFVILFLAIGAVSWLTMARLVRGQVLSLRAQPFVEAAYASGVGTVRVLWRHLLPNLAGPVVACATLVIPQAILQESFLSFLGIGVQAPMPSLGLLAADGVESVNTFVGFWWLITFPCGILVLTLLALNFIGDGLRDALDPKSSASVMI
ncbi:MAG: ABC transporter permease [Phycisphaerae bacterium]